MRHPNLVQRRGTYCFRRRVPADLHGLWQGGLVVVKSLYTRDRRIAVERLHAVQGELQKKFDGCRKASAHSSERAAHAQASGSYKLSDWEIAALVDEWKLEQLANIDTTANRVFSDGHAQDLTAEIDHDIAVASSPITEEVAQEIGITVNRLLVRSGAPSTRGLGRIKLQAKDAGIIRCAVAEETTQKLFAAVRKAEIQLAIMRKDAVQGRSSSVPSYGAGVASRALYKLDDLLRDFSSDPGRGSRTDKTNLDYGMVFRLMRDVIGSQKVVSAIRREDCTQIRDLLLVLPRDATKRHPGTPLTQITRGAGEAGLRLRTINSHLSKMASIFSWAVAEQRLDKSPATKIYVAESDDERHREKAIFYCR